MGTTAPPSITGDFGDTPITRLVKKISDQQLCGYRSNPTLVKEHANHERDMEQGSYGRRQLFELIQNGADAILGHKGGRIVVCLTDKYFYCANEGDPIDESGVEAILHSHLSVKRGNQIGRFGLGFKSVLGVTNRPEFHSKVGSFAFNGDKAKDRIAKVVPNAENFPALRLAFPLDSKAAAATDSILNELRHWATTVIRLPRAIDQTSWLSKDLETFPPEFVLFCPDVGRLELVDSVTKNTRTISVDRKNGRAILHGGSEPVEWKIFETKHKPSKEAKNNAGELASRKELPLIWAVPCSGRLTTGKLWAFFPLNEATTLSGILNAPWKTNDDRSALLEGVFNKEMLQAASQLVVNHLADVVDHDDPGRVLDFMPARGRELRGWADGVITEAVYEISANQACLPDQEGTFCFLRDLKIHPPDLPQEVLLFWSEQPERPCGWVHPSVETRERRPRVERLLETANQRPSNFRDWLLALDVDRQKALSLKPCIRVAAKLGSVADTLKERAAKNEAGVQNEFGRVQLYVNQLKNCPILVDHEDEEACLDPKKVFLSSKDVPTSKYVRLVHKSLCADLEIVKCLKMLGLSEATLADELGVLASQLSSTWSDAKWAEFWQLARTVERERAVELLEGKDIYVRTVGGAFKLFWKTLLPGKIVPEDGSRDKDIAVDQKFHNTEFELLLKLGVRHVPSENCTRNTKVFRTYKDAMIEEYLNNRSESPHPQKDLLELSNESYTGPLEVFPDLSKEARIAFTCALIIEPKALEPWKVKHSSRSEVYKPAECDSPELWAIKRWGILKTTFGPKQVNECIGPQLKKMSKFLPVAECDEKAAEHLGMAVRIEDLNADDWEEALGHADDVTDDESLGWLYDQACRQEIRPPDTVRCRLTPQRHGHIDREKVTAVNDRDDFNSLHKTKTPCLLVKDKAAAERLVTRWGLRSAKESVKTEIAHTPARDPLALRDQFPVLEFHVDKVPLVDLIECTELRIETVTKSGKSSRSETFRVEGKEGKLVYWHSDLGIEMLLEYLNNVYSFELSHEQRDAILKQHHEHNLQQRIAKIHALGSDAERLLECLGVNAIKQRLPARLIEAVEASYGLPTPIQFAEVALAVYAADTLKEYKEELRNAGLTPPQRWSGHLETRRFVNELGFRRPFAGYQEQSRAPTEIVDGPMALPRLHPYQCDIVKGVHGLILGPDSEQRALISLPTGAGKTRVAVQAIVELFCNHDFGGPVLWVAPNDELCEQAVQTWREVWRSLGSQRQLNISRLWGNNGADLIEDGKQVVVATIDKLKNCFEVTKYDWLKEATLLLIDEAHAATTPEYTKLLEWQGLARNQTRCPLLGLTATPFRGRSEEQTNRLANRFGRTRLDRSLGDDPYAELQNLGVLAQVEHSMIEGIEVHLDDSEIKGFNDMHRLPSSVRERVAADQQRNQTLLKDVLELDTDWPVLMFCASVEHAQIMAALLKMEGRSAVPISGETPSGVRRNAIDEFRKGKIQILTNYGVLVQGFDAPAVRVVYVARPTFSPNIYQQMIGRGLRGPLNGGKEICRIVNVEDTFAQFGKRLAFREFEHLWDKNS